MLLESLFGAAPAGPRTTVYRMTRVLFLIDIIMSFSYARIQSCSRPILRKI